MDWARILAYVTGECRERLGGLLRYYHQEAE